MAILEFGQTPVEPAFWFLDASLYHSEDYNFDGCRSHGFKNYRENLMSVIFPNITIDVYCPSCKRETVFRPVNRENEWEHAGRHIVKAGVNYAHFECSRKHCSSDLYYVFNIGNGVVTKIGQFPSIADLISPGIKKYGPVIDTSLLADWQRAIGLRAHGIGAGSYVYLRRIIENMVNNASELATQEGKLDVDIYNKSRWPERIKLLSGYLPNYLVENAIVYGVLSKGVHELSEEECANYFEVMHTSIEIICEERLAERERNTKASAGAAALQRVMQEIKEEED